MAKGILGKKIGMTQIFSEAGLLIPVTVIEVNPNVVLQKKVVATDGYNAIQLGYDDKKAKAANKAEVGHAKAANTAPKRFVKEIAGEEMLGFEVGQLVKEGILIKPLAFNNCLATLISCIGSSDKEILIVLPMFKSSNVDKPNVDLIIPGINVPGSVIPICNG